MVAVEMLTMGMIKLFEVKNLNNYKQSDVGK
jgi:hypothetical protein